jgi:multidrug resistance protein
MASAILEPIWKPKHNPWLIALTVTLATFMEVLDTSIANVALPHIAGSVGASQDEATWVLTSYLVSSAIILPISGWISNRIGRKRFYMTCVVMFTVCSALCGFAPSLGFLIVARILQGLGGGGLAPSEQAILADTFPIEKRGQAFAVYGMAVVVAPAIGPTLGGWITDNYNWHWIFFINIPIGLISLWLSHRMVEDPDPIVDLKLLKNRNFGTAVFLQLILGMVLFGSTVLIPQYLQVLLGYSAERAGMALSPAGFVMMVMMFVAGRTLGKSDPRLTVMLGYLAVAAGLYNLTRLDLYSSFGTVTTWRMLQVIGLPFIFIPISTLNYVGVPREKSNQISSLSNFARNMGGSAGTALLTTYLARSAQIHQTNLAANITAGSYAVTAYIRNFAANAHISFAAAQPIALAQVYGQMLRQASMLAYKNAFAILAGIVFMLSPLVWIMRLPPKAAKPDPEQLAGH